MGQILVRNLDDAVVAALKQRAKTAGRSLEAEAREILSRSVRESREAFLTFAAEFRRKHPVPPGFDVVATIHSGLE